MECEITEDIRKLLGDEKLSEVRDYVRKRMNYSFEAGKKRAQKELLEEICNKSEFSTCNDFTCDFHITIDELRKRLKQHSSN